MQGRQLLPQVLGSALETHPAPPQVCDPAGQTSDRQTPPLQNWFAPHFSAQPPQLAGSLAVSTQLLPQAVVPAPQVGTQTPPEQRLPAGHTFPQAPQSSGSSLRSVQAPPQLVWPATHETAQAPLEHAVPGAQTF